MISITDIGANDGLDYVIIHESRIANDDNINERHKVAG